MPEKLGPRRRRRPGAGAIRRQMDLRRAPGLAAAGIRRLVGSPVAGGEQREEEQHQVTEAAAAKAKEATITALKKRKRRFQWRCHDGAPSQPILICTGDSFPAEREFASVCWKDFSCPCMKEQ